MPEKDMALTSTHWGTYRVEVSDGRVVALHPFERDPDPSPIGHGIAATIDDDKRIRSPMVRRGWRNGTSKSADGERGRDTFEAVSWDEAESLVADELNRVRRTFGNSAIYGGSYGWASAGRFHHAQSQIHRFLNCIGGYTRSVNTYSYAAAEVAIPHVLGDFKTFVNSTTSWSSVSGNTELFVAFGGVPVKNGQIDNGGVGEHGQRAGILEAARNGTSFVNVSPTRASMPAEVNAEWLDIRPCTDTALMLALAYVLLEEDLADRKFLERFTVGIEKVEQYLQGRIDGVAKTPDWAAGICQIASEDIRSLARKMAAKRCKISVSWSLTRQQYGEQPFWAGITVAAMLGQIGLPGGGIGFGYSATNGIGAQYQRLPYASLPQGENPVSGFIPVARIADMLLNPGSTFTYDGETHTYPDIRLVYWAGGNPFHHHQDLNRLDRAWQVPETIITHDWCWTSTARFSDIVLPCTTHLERADLALSPRDAYVVSMQQAIQPTGNARDDYSIFSAIARKMGLELEFTEGKTAEEWVTWIYDSSRQRFARAGLELPTLDDLKSAGWHKIDMPDEPTVMLEAFRKSPETAPLKTPSGRIELFSEKVAAFGYRDCPGHAAWLPPDEWLGSPDKERYPLHLICVQPQTKLHSQLDHGPVSQAAKIDGCEPVHICPADAAARGISDRQRVKIFNERGTCRAAAVLDDDIRPGVVQINTGAWYDPDENGTCKNGNPNVLTPDIGTSSLAQGPSAHSCLVEIAPA